MVGFERIAWVWVAIVVACSPDPSPRSTPSVGRDGAAPNPDMEAPRDAALPPPRRCNGAPHLCARRYDEVTYGTTHNAMSSYEGGWFGANQNFGVPRQLADGVRGFMLDVHYGADDSVQLCHSLCAYGAQALTEGLAEIYAFLADAPNEVVTLIFESYVSPADLDASLAASGLGAMAHRQRTDALWPTLGALIDAGDRVVVFSDVRADAPRFPAQHYVWDYAWETHWHAQRPEDLSCQPNRGLPEHPLFILNHFLTYPIALEHLAETVNHNPGLLDRARACWAESGRRPNFVTVDFHDIGDLGAVVDALNAP